MGAGDVEVVEPPSEDVVERPAELVVVGPVDLVVEADEVAVTVVEPGSVPPTQATRIRAIVKTPEIVLTSSG